MIRLLTPHPALMVENGERLMLAADLHLGMEYDLAKQGISIPYQWSRMLDELMVLLEEHRPDRLVLLGDVKHGVPATSFQERREIPGFFETLLGAVDEIDITRGNHDANIQQFLPKEVHLHSSKGIMFGEGFRVAAMHGHAWPPPESAAADCVVMAHNHPTVLLNTPLGIKVSQRAWVRGACDRVNLAKAFLEQDNVKSEGDPVAEFVDRYKVEPGCPEIIIMPMFNDLLGGLPVNAESPKSLLGPLFRTEAVDLEGFYVYLLDGTYVGKVGFLRRRLESV
jgi:metallophosphoesterase superfamily enzyme